jgi:hypothetical protein
VRAFRFYVLSRPGALALARRALSVASLVALDVAGLALGIYLALVIRQAIRGEDILWSLLWRDGAAEWLRWAAPITVLVFAQAGLYRQRERRAGAGRILASLVVVGLIVFAFGYGTDYDFASSGLIPTAVVVSFLTIGLLRSAYDSVTLELMRAAGVRRKVVLVGEGKGLAALHASLAATRGGLGYEFAGAITSETVPGLRRLGSREELPAVLEAVRPDEVILSEANVTERTVLEVVEHAHRQGIKVRLAPATTELLVQRGEYVPGHGVPLFELRPPVLTATQWVLKRAFDIVVSLLVGLLLLPLWLLVALAVKLDSRGPVFHSDRRIGVGEKEFGMLKFRTMVADAAALQPALEEANEARSSRSATTRA